MKSRSLETLPAWSLLLRQEDERWQWFGQQLIHRDRRQLDIPRQLSGKLQKLVVEYVYAAQKRSKQVEACLHRLLDDLGEEQWGLNLGSGDTYYNDRVINLDIQDANTINILNIGTELPFEDNSLDLVISQEALEHIEEPFRTIEEIHRVLRPGGKFYCQVPFIIGFHPGPCDYWRFSRQALEHMLDNERWKMNELANSLGHGSGFYRILVEFLAVNASIISQRLYRPVKGLSALLCFPLQWLDVLTPFTKEKDRIPGGYYCVTEKR